MRSGHGGAAAVRMCALLAMLCHTQSVRAQALSAQVVCVDPRSSELVTRVNGQTRDLPLRLRWIANTFHDLGSEGELATVARDQAADFVVAIRPVAGGHTVYIYAAKQRALRTRKVPKPRRNERFSGSAAAEAVALIVRGELSAALASLREVELAQPDQATPTSSATEPPRAPTSTQAPAAAEAKPTPPPEPKATQPEPDDPRPPSAAGPSAFALPLRLSAAAGLRASIPLSDHVLAAPALLLQLKLANVGIGLSASSSFDMHLRQEALDIALRRHALQLELFAWLAPHPDVQLLLGPAVGLVLYQRSTRAGADKWDKTGDKTLRTANLTALAEVRWRFAHRVGLSVRAGVDFVLSPARFTYGVEAQTGEIPLARMSSYEPWAAACVFVDIAE